MLRGSVASIALLLAISLPAPCRAGVVLKSEDGSKLEVSEKTFNRLTGRLGSDTEIEWEEQERDPTLSSGRWYRVASRYQFTYLFCCDGEEIVLDTAEALSVFFDKNPGLISGEGISVMVSGCQLVRWPSHVLQPGGDIGGFHCGSANGTDFARCVGKGPVFERMDSQKWRLTFQVLYGDGAVDRILVVGSFAPFRIGEIQTVSLMPPGSFSWPFLGTFRIGHPVAAPGAAPTSSEMSTAAKSPTEPSDAR